MEKIYIDEIAKLKAQLEEDLESNNDLKSIDTLFNLAKALVDEGRHNEAATYLIHSSKLADESAKIPNANKLDVFYYSAEFLCHTNMANNALEISSKALDIIEGNYTEYIPVAFMYIYQHAVILDMAGHTAEAEKMLNKALDIAHELYGEKSIEEAECSIALGKIHLENGKIEQALREFEKALECTKGSNNDTSALIADIILSIAKVNLELGNEIEAKRRTDEAIAELDSYEWDDDARVMILLDAFNIYIALSLKPQARSTLEEVIEIEENLCFEKSVIENHKRILKLLEDIK
ncbi:MAG: tetratricopeptide repeat protein [Sphaerochaetaceae bacterium]|nr:tetratricopeptide repeat protein [Sphaerochaetaceae bacterium]